MDSSFIHKHEWMNESIVTSSNVHAPHPASNLWAGENQWDQGHALSCPYPQLNGLHNSAPEYSYHFLHLVLYHSRQLSCHFHHTSPVILLCSFSILFYYLILKQVFQLLPPVLCNAEFERAEWESLTLRIERECSIWVHQQTGTIIASEILGP